MVAGQLDIMYIYNHFDGTVKCIHDEEDELFQLSHAFIVI